MSWFDALWEEPAKDPKQEAAERLERMKKEAEIRRLLSDEQDESNETVLRTMFDPELVAEVRQKVMKEQYLLQELEKQAQEEARKKEQEKKKLEQQEKEKQVPPKAPAPAPPPLPTPPPPPVLATASASTSASTVASQDRSSSSSGGRSSRRDHRGNNRQSSRESSRRSSHHHRSSRHDKRHRSKSRERNSTHRHRDSSHHHPRDERDRRQSDRERRDRLRRRSPSPPPTFSAHPSQSFECSEVTEVSYDERQFEQAPTKSQTNRRGSYEPKPPHIGEKEPLQPIPDKQEPPPQVVPTPPKPPPEQPNIFSSFLSMGTASSAEASVVTTDDDRGDDHAVLVAPPTQPQQADQPNIFSSFLSIGTASLADASVATTDGGDAHDAPPPRPSGGFDFFGFGTPPPTSQDGANQTAPTQPPPPSGGSQQQQQQQPQPPPRPSGGFDFFGFGSAPPGSDTNNQTPTQPPLPPERPSGGFDVLELFGGQKKPETKVPATESVMRKAGSTLMHVTNDVVQITKNAGNEAVKAGQNFSAEVVTAGQNVGTGMVKAGSEVVKAGSDVVKVGKHVGDEIVQAGKSVGNEVVKAGKTVSNQGSKVVKSAVGKSTKITVASQSVPPQPEPHKQHAEETATQGEFQQRQAPPESDPPPPPPPPPPRPLLDASTQTDYDDQRARDREKIQEQKLELKNQRKQLTDQTQQLEQALVQIAMVQMEKEALEKQVVQYQGELQMILQLLATPVGGGSDRAGENLAILAAAASADAMAASREGSRTEVDPGAQGIIEALELTIDDMQQQLDEATRKLETALVEKVALEATVLRLQQSLEEQQQNQPDPVSTDVHQKEEEASGLRSRIHELEMELELEKSQNAAGASLIGLKDADRKIEKQSNQGDSEEAAQLKTQIQELAIAMKASSDAYETKISTLEETIKTLEEQKGEVTDLVPVPTEGSAKETHVQLQSKIGETRANISQHSPSGSKSEFDALLKDIKRLECELEDLRVAREVVAESRDLLDADVKSLREEISDLKEKMSVAVADAQNLERINREIISEKESLELAQSALRDENESLCRDISNLKIASSQMEALQVEMTRLDAENTSLREREALAQDIFKCQATQHDSPELREKTSRMELENKSLLDAKTALASKATQLESSLSELRDTVHGLRLENESLSSQRDSLSEEISQLKADAVDATVLSTTISRLKNECKSSREERDTLAAEAAKFRVTAVELEDVHEQVAALRGKHKACFEENAILGQEIAKLKNGTMMVALEEKLGRQELKVERILEEKEVYVLDMLTLNTSAIEHRLQLDEATSKLVEMEVKWRQCEREWKAAIEAKDALEQSLNSSRETAENLADTNQNLLDALTKHVPAADGDAGAKRLIAMEVKWKLSERERKAAMQAKAALEESLKLSQGTVDSLAETNQHLVEALTMKATTDEIKRIVAPRTKDARLAIVTLTRDAAIEAKDALEQSLNSSRETAKNLADTNQNLLDALTKHVPAGDGDARAERLIAMEVKWKLSERERKAAMQAKAALEESLKLSQGTVDSLTETNQHLVEALTMKATTDEIKRIVAPWTKDARLAIITLTRDAERAQEERREAVEMRTILETNLQESTATIDDLREANRGQADEINLLSEKMAVLSKSNQDCEVRLNKALEKVASLEDALLCTTREREQAIEARDAADSSLMEFETSIAHLRETNQALVGERETLVTTNNDLEASKAGVMSNLLEASEKIRSLEQALETSKLECQELARSKELAEASLRLSEAIVVDLREQNNTRVKENAALRGQLGDLSSTMEKTTANLSNDLFEEKTSLIAKNEALHAQVTQLSGRVTALEADNKHLERTLADIKTSLADAESEVLRLRMAPSIRDIPCRNAEGRDADTIATLNSKVENLLQENGACSSKIEGLEKMAGLKDEKIASLTNELVFVRADLKQSVDARAVLEKTLRDSETRDPENDGRIGNLQLMTLESDKQELTMELQRLRAVLQTAVGARERLEASLTESTATAEELRRENATLLEAELASKTQYRAVLQEKNALEKRLMELELLVPERDIDHDHDVRSTDGSYHTALSSVTGDSLISELTQRLSNRSVAKSSVKGSRREREPNQLGADLDRLRAQLDEATDARERLEFSVQESEAQVKELQQKLHRRETARDAQFEKELLVRRIWHLEAVEASNLAALQVLTKRSSHLKSYCGRDFERANKKDIQGAQRPKVAFESSIHQTQHLDDPDLHNLEAIKRLENELNAVCQELEAANDAQDVLGSALFDSQIKVKTLGERVSILQKEREFNTASNQVTRHSLMKEVSEHLLLNRIQRLEDIEVHHRGVIELLKSELAHVRALKDDLEMDINAVCLDLEESNDAQDALGHSLYESQNKIKSLCERISALETQLEHTAHVQTEKLSEPLLASSRTGAVESELLESQNQVRSLHETVQYLESELELIKTSSRVERSALTKKLSELLKTIRSLEAEHLREKKLPGSAEERPSNVVSQSKPEMVQDDGNVAAELGRWLRQPREQTQDRKDTAQTTPVPNGSASDGSSWRELKVALLSLQREKTELENERRTMEGQLREAIHAKEVAECSCEDSQLVIKNLENTISYFEKEAAGSSSGAGTVLKSEINKHVLAFQNAGGEEDHTDISSNQSVEVHEVVEVIEVHESFYSVTSELDALAADLENALQDLAESNEARDRAQHSLDVAQAKIGELQAELQAFDSKTYDEESAIIRENQVLEREIADLEGKLLSIDTELVFDQKDELEESFRESFTAAEERLYSVTSENQALKESLDNLRKDLSNSLRSKFHELSQELKDSAATREALEASLKSYEDTIASLSVDLERATAENVALIAANAAMNTRLAQTTKVLGDAMVKGKGLDPSDKSLFAQVSRRLQMTEADGTVCAGYLKSIDESGLSEGSGDESERRLLGEQSSDLRTQIERLTTILDDAQADVVNIDQAEVADLADRLSRFVAGADRNKRALEERNVRLNGLLVDKKALQNTIDTLAREQRQLLTTVYSSDDMARVSRRRNERDGANAVVERIENERHALMMRIEQLQTGLERTMHEPEDALASEDSLAMELQDASRRLQEMESLRSAREETAAISDRTAAEIESSANIIATLTQGLESAVAILMSVASGEQPRSSKPAASHDHTALNQPSSERRRNGPAGLNETIAIKESLDASISENHWLIHQLDHLRQNKEEVVSAKEGVEMSLQRATAEIMVWRDAISRIESIADSVIPRKGKISMIDPSVMLLLDENDRKKLAKEVAHLVERVSIIKDRMKRAEILLKERKLTKEGKMKSSSEHGLRKSSGTSGASIISSSAHTPSKIGDSDSAVPTSSKQHEFSSMKSARQRGSTGSSTKSPPPPQSPKRTDQKQQMAPSPNISREKPPTRKARSPKHTTDKPLASSKGQSKSAPATDIAIPTGSQSSLQRALRETATVEVETVLSDSAHSSVVGTSAAGKGNAAGKGKSSLAAAAVSNLSKQQQSSKGTSKRSPSSPSSTRGKPPTAPRKKSSSPYK